MGYMYVLNVVIRAVTTIIEIIHAEAPQKRLSLPQKKSFNLIPQAM